MTEWRSVVGHEGAYEVSDDGQGRSIDRTMITVRGVRLPLKGQPLRPALASHGYLTVNLGKKSTYIHRAVAEAFLGPAPSADHQVCHNDGSKTNNAVSNLRWGTRSDNMR